MNEDTVCSPNHIELCTNLRTSELGTPLYTGQSLGPSGVLYSGVPLYCIRVANVPWHQAERPYPYYIAATVQSCNIHTHIFLFNLPAPYPSHRPLDRRSCSTRACPQSTRMQDARGGGMHMKVHITHERLYPNTYSGLSLNSARAHTHTQLHTPTHTFASYTNSPIHGFQCVHKVGQRILRQWQP